MLEGGKIATVSTCPKQKSLKELSMSAEELLDPFISLPAEPELLVLNNRGVVQDGCIPCSIRFSEILDHSSDRRRERIVSIFGPVEFREISTASAHGLVQHDGAFDVFICSVDDVARLRLAVRPPADKIIKSKISFAYSQKTSPGRRAQLLKLGFDDVFYSSMSDEEIRIRFKSIVSRSINYSNNDKKEAVKEFDEFCSSFVNGQLRGKQKEIIEKLLEAKGGVVSYRDLANYDYALNEYNTASLKSTVSYLRKKLHMCEIVSVNGEGYKIIVKNEIRERA